MYKQKIKYLLKCGMDVNSTCEGPESNLEQIISMILFNTNPNHFITTIENEKHASCILGDQIAAFYVSKEE